MREPNIFKLKKNHCNRTRKKQLILYTTNPEFNENYVYVTLVNDADIFKYLILIYPIFNKNAFSRISIPKKIVLEENIIFIKEEIKDNQIIKQELLDKNTKIKKILQISAGNIVLKNF